MESTPRKGKKGLARLWRALWFSVDGLEAAWAESAFRQELLLAAILAPVALLLPLPLLHTGILLAALLLVLITELLNSAVEAAVDRVSLDHHTLAKRAKDFGSAAVLLSLINCVVVWVFTLADVYL
jgi:diacylglycerol kinase (ATP)